MVKRVYILIGPKGSGKSFIGTLLEKYYGIKFLRVENSVKKIKLNQSIDNPEYVHHAFRTIESRVRKYMKNEKVAVFESTGLTKYFDQMLKSLRIDFKVITIRISSDLKLCLDRVKSRDQSIHINVSEEQVKQINLAVEAKKMKTDFEIDNNYKSTEQLCQEIGRVIKS